jgi:hypothetical protein
MRLGRCGLIMLDPQQYTGPLASRPQITHAYFPFVTIFALDFLAMGEYLQKPLNRSLATLMQGG